MTKRTVIKRPDTLYGSSYVTSTDPLSQRTVGVHNTHAWPIYRPIDMNGMVDAMAVFLKPLSNKRQSIAELRITDENKGPSNTREW